MDFFNTFCQPFRFLFREKNSTAVWFSAEIWRQIFFIWRKSHSESLENEGIWAWFYTLKVLVFRGKLSIFVPSPPLSSKRSLFYSLPNVWEAGNFVICERLIWYQRPSGIADDCVVCIWNACDNREVLIETLLGSKAGSELKNWRVFIVFICMNIYQQAQWIHRIPANIRCPMGKCQYPL